MLSNNPCTAGSCPKSATTTYEGQAVCDGHANTRARIDDAPAAGVSQSRGLFGRRK
jgi:hypothetical protein